MSLLGRRVLAVIPARGGSKSVPRKNIRPVGGKPLLAYTVETARRAEIFDDIVVTTDDAEIQRVAIEAGAQAPFLRPKELATDTALAIPTIQHAVREMEQRSGRPYDVVAMLQPTTPLRTSDDLVVALRRLIEEEADGIISVVDVDNWHPLKMKRIIDGLLVDYESSAVENPPRQSLPKVYMVNGALYATRRDVLMGQGTFKGSRCLGHVMPKERSVNIDGEDDFTLAEHFLKQARKDTKESSLQKIYENVYATGKENFFTAPTDDVTREVVAELSSWKGLRVFEAGCGTGETASALAEAGAEVLAVDWAAPAIEEARRRHTNPRLRFEVGSFDAGSGAFDVVVLQEVIEHAERPLEVLEALAKRLGPGGQMILTCPSFLNLRGAVWMTLQKLFDVPMSLTDRHFLNPWELEAWAKELGCECRWRTFRYTQAHGSLMVTDMKKRLTNALRDAGMDNGRVPDLIAWMEKAGQLETDRAHNGAKALYRFTRRS